MFKLIIADDERTIRESIFASVNWNDLDMQVVGLAMNGSEAYAMVLDELPDIVLTDIRMPGLSGLELIAQIASAMPQVVFVVLSGYDDFRFAQEAMVLGVRYYLLKPCPKAQLIEALQEAKKECYRRQVNDIYHSRQLPEKMGSAVEQAKEFVRKNIGNPNLSLKWIAENILYLNINRSEMYPVSLALKLFCDPTTSSDYGAMFAMSMLSIVPVVLIFIFLQDYLVEGIATSGLKG